MSRWTGTGFSQGWRALALLGIAVVLGSCSSDSGPPDVVLTSIDLSPAAVTLAVGATQRFTATGHFSDGSTGAVSVTWTATGGTVSGTGLYLAGTDAGSFRVVATQVGGTIQRAAEVTLTAAPPVLTSISVAPSPISLAPGATQQFVATGHYSGGSTGSVNVEWSATGGTITAGGLYTAGATSGAWQVTAKQQGGSVEGSSNVTITAAPPTLTSITVAPSTVTLAPGGTQSFTATAHYSDGSSGSLPVDWTATGGTVTASGLYTAGPTAGAWQVTARQQGGSMEGSSNVTITAAPPTLTSITVAPATVTLTHGGTQAFAATAHFSDGSTGSLPVNWTATGGTVTSGGLYTAGTTDGSYSVTATDPATSIAGSATVTIAGAVNIVAIELSPDSARLLGGVEQQFTAVGRLASGGTTPVNVTWSTETATVGSVQNSISATGLFKAGGPLGRYIVTATQVGGSLTGTAPVIVHGTGGLGPEFWTPTAGTVRLCTSNHFTDDGTRSGTATVTVSSGGGVVAPTVAFTTDPNPHMYGDGSGEIVVLCQPVWTAPPGMTGEVQVYISVASTRPGTGMAKVFVYDKLQCFTTTLPITERPCGRTDDNRPLAITFSPPNWTTAAVVDSAVGSLTKGANIWFKVTAVP